MQQNTKKLFVGNLDWDTNEDSLKEFFAKVGTVAEVNIIYDKVKNRSKGFGFVTMSSEEEAAKAIEQLDGTELDGRELRVAPAKPRKDRA
jgi:RNA recognition motif-containing protein